MFDPKSIAESLFGHVQAIPAGDIDINPQVRELCKQNACGFYGKNWTCPPAVASLEDMKKCFAPFDSLLVVYEVYPLKSGFDWKGMMAGMDAFHKNLQAMKKAMDKEASSDDFLILGAGACNLCKTCTYASGDPCRNPEDAIVSLEASGIDVMKLMKDHGMKYNNGQNTVTYVGGVLYQS